MHAYIPFQYYMPHSHVSALTETFMIVWERMYIPHQTSKPETIMIAWQMNLKVFSTHPNFLLSLSGLMDDCIPIMFKALRGYSTKTYCCLA